MQCIHLASDHAGFDLKKSLVSRLSTQGYDITDHGTNAKESCDYPVFAHKLCAAVENTNSIGILLCGSGIGMSMAANRHQGIRAALCVTELHARLSRMHNDANVLCLGARLIGEEMAFAVVESFLATQFENGRHQRRLDQINVPAAR